MTEAEDRTELNRMIAGEPYVAFTPLLTRLRNEQFLRNFDLNHERDPERQLALFRSFIKIKPESECYIFIPFHCEFGFNISMGTGGGIGPNCRLLDICPITIGDRVLLAPGVQLLTARHKTNPEARNGMYGREDGAPITIHDDVWIGGSAIILPDEGRARASRCSGQSSKSDQVGRRMRTSADDG